MYVGPTFYNYNLGPTIRAYKVGTPWGPYICDHRIMLILSMIGTKITVFSILRSFLKKFYFFNALYQKVGPIQIGVKLSAINDIQGEVINLRVEILMHVDLN